MRILKARLVRYPPLNSKIIALKKRHPPLNTIGKNRWAGVLFWKKTKRGCLNRKKRADWVYPF
nr:MAG TPA: hypothetical protein [Caudoviricetes sp.]